MGYSKSKKSFCFFLWPLQKFSRGVQAFQGGGGGGSIMLICDFLFQERRGPDLVTPFPINYGPYSHRLTDWPQTSLIIANFINIIVAK